MERVILIRFGEIFLKGKNRGYFEKSLFSNIKIPKLSIFLKPSIGLSSPVIATVTSLFVNTAVRYSCGTTKKSLVKVICISCAFW